MGRNVPSPEGRQLGEQLARMTEIALKEAPAGAFPDRCKSCAYRDGTFPNGCAETVLDALKTAIHGEPFYCHQFFNEDGTPRDVCAGWMILTGTKTLATFREAVLPVVPAFKDWVLDRSDEEDETQKAPPAAKAVSG